MLLDRKETIYLEKSDILDYIEKYLLKIREGKKEVTSFNVITKVVNGNKRRVLQVMLKIIPEN